MSDLLKLNVQQREAVTALEGPVLVLAGAGSGKTRVVTTRIVHLIENGVPPSRILGVTFTNKAAEEMRERVRKLTNHQVLICTFHSLGARVLRESIYALGYQRDFTIYDEDDVEKLLKACLVELNLKDKKMDIKPFRHLISQAKNALQTPDQLLHAEWTTDVEQAFPQVYALYQKKLQEYQAVDFDDLLFLTVKVWKEHPGLLTRYQERWAFVLIDEYQDTNAAQYAMARLLVEKRRNLFVVGDPDQSIYSWRGANIQNILNFERDYPGAKIIRLEQNYRSHTHILQAANALISHNANRYEKKLWSDLGPGEKIKLFIGEDERAEADFVATQIAQHRSKQSIPLNEMVVFYRTNAQSRVFEDYLLGRGVPYIIVGGLSFYQRREIKDILAFLRIAQSGADFISFARTINLPKRGLGEASIEKIRQGANEEGMTILAYCEALLTEKPLRSILRLSAKQKEGVADYMRIIHELRQLAKQGSIRDLVLAAIEGTGYLPYLMEDKETYEERRENLDELIAKAVEWEMSAPDPSLEAFLEELSLKSSLDEADQSQDRLSLMTIHNGKGLEFKVTFLVGLEEDLFPHVNSKNNSEEIEEERRLCYVGITRAKDFLYLSYCHTRYLWGNLRMQKPSRFLKEIPNEHLERCRQSQQVSRAALWEAPSQERVKYVEQPLPKQTEEFSPGDTIFHKDFGIGQIKEAYQGSMGLTYKVLFSKDNSLKTLVAKYAILNRL
ncbi:ATP-dependent helicase [Candidatus Protochlamydia phocaeensis]|uniref:ATP-dependent helicase n=1 Tax=Candidatus Protochlamydia phocaeensis TaxID=1414722 RepID=UPI000838CF29|nr:UvrD-helicase domain-containing protein [Candidatus Protochlamydia phocaeensis]